MSARWNRTALEALGVAGAVVALAVALPYLFGYALDDKWFLEQKRAHDQSKAEHLDAERARFASLYPKVQIHAFKVAPVKALREIRSGTSRFFFDPDSGLLLFGELLDKSGQVVSAYRGPNPDNKGGLVKTSLSSQRPSAADLHDSAAIEISDGAVPVTAYLDFRCGHCVRAVHSILDGKSMPNAALRVVFVLRSEEDFALATHVACASKHLRARALIQAFGGVPSSDRLSCEKGRSVAAEHVRVVARNGVSATPVFAVGNQTVLGFNEERLGSLMHQTGEIPGELK